MRCKNCDYALWNISTRQCPECATVFKPSDFEFAPNSVRFRCPYCEQHYYGTDARGHLVPTMFECVGCKQRIHMDEMVLLPAEGASEQQTKVDRMPWLERGERGPVKAWLATIKWAMVEPNRLIRAVPENSSPAGAWFYAMLTAIAFLVVGIIVPQLVFGGIGGMRTRGPIGFVGVSLGSLAALVIGLALFIFLWALITHGILRITGRAVRPFGRTCHAIYYSAGASMPGLIPCCGVWVGLAWWVVSATNMVKEAHRIHGGRAALAVLTLPTIMAIIAPFAWYAWLMWMFMGGMAGAGMGPGAAAWTPQNMSLMSLNNNLIQYSFQNSGNGPEHAIELMVFQNMAGWPAAGNSAFCQQGTKTTATTIPVNASTFQAFQGLTRSQKLGELQKLMDAMPASVVAHRMGDFVFTYHGAALNTMDANLWTVIMLPDPDVNGPPQPGDPIIIGTAAYGLQSVTYGQLLGPSGLLQQQNAHRATLTLPPLPDPAMVTHTKPAVAGSAAPATQAGP